MQIDLATVTVYLETIKNYLSFTTYSLLPSFLLASSCNAQNKMKKKVHFWARKCKSIKYALKLRKIVTYINEI